MAHPEAVGEDEGARGGLVAANLELRVSAAGGHPMGLASLWGVLGLDCLLHLAETSTAELRDILARAMGHGGHAVATAVSSGAH